MFATANATSTRDRPILARSQPRKRGFSQRSVTGVVTDRGEPASEGLPGEHGRDADPAGGERRGGRSYSGEVGRVKLPSLGVSCNSVRSYITRLAMTTSDG